MNRLLPLLGALCAACAPRTKPAETPVESAIGAAPESADASPSPATSAPGSALLAPAATYGELVRSAIAREGGNVRNDDRCLLAAGERGFELRAASAPAIRPLPLPASDLDVLLKGSDEVELLSAWGRYGSGRASAAFATFTPHAPARGAVLLILTDRGWSLRGPSGANVRPHDGLDTRGALDLLATLRAERPLVVVAAESSLPLEGVRGMLAALDASRLASALAVNLSADTRLPPSAARAAPRCADGLSATDAPEGALPDAALANGIAALREGLPDCLGRGDARGAAGGKLTLAFRIAAEGRVAEACIARDDIQDPGVAACVIELARTLTFAPPSPSGVLDIELPLALRPAAGEGPHALCPL